MSFRTVSDFAAWEYERSAASKVFAGLTGAWLAQAVVPGGRTLGFIAWHIAVAIPEMMGHAGIAVEGASPEAPAPQEAATIAATYQQLAGALLEAVKAHWTDAQLAHEIPMYGESWKKGFVLGALIAHRTHHRGQMTVLMRQAGLKVPGIHGPAREEWAALGMPEQP